MNVNKSLLEKRKILIISHYSGMPLQLAEPNPGTFSAHSHLWDSVKWKQRDQPRFQIHSNLQFTFSIPSPALGLFHFRDLGLVPEKSKRTLGRGGRQNCAARMKAFKIGAEISEGLYTKNSTEDIFISIYQLYKRLHCNISIHVYNVFWSNFPLFLITPPFLTFNRFHYSSFMHTYI
jgi:hypothetical protein